MSAMPTKRWKVRAGNMFEPKCGDDEESRQAARGLVNRVIEEQVMRIKVIVEDGQSISVNLVE